MKILILPDGQNWVVDRNCQALIKSLPEIEFTVRSFTHGCRNKWTRGYELQENGLTSETFATMANDYDIVHHFNADIRWLWHGLNSLEKPLLISVRSHRFPSKVKAFLDRPKTYFHVINRDLLKDFPGATYIPNGIFDQFKGNGFTVGYAGHPHETAKEYDGYHLIKRACEDLGVTFKPALNLLPKEMPDYYRSINLYICASVAEGFSTGVMEALAMNVPAISVDTGEARHFVPFTIERSVEGIKRGIQKYYTQDLVREYRWDKLAPAYRELYEQVYSAK